MVRTQIGSKAKAKGPALKRTAERTDYSITPAMKNKLLDLGHDIKAIRIMTPLEARENINKSKGK